MAFSSDLTAQSITKSLRDADISPMTLYIPFEVIEIKEWQIIQERTDKREKVCYGALWKIR